MSHLTYFKTLKFQSLPPFFLFVILGMAISPIVFSITGNGLERELFVSTPIVFSAPEIQAVEIVDVDVPLKDINEKVAAVAPKMAQEKSEAYLKIPKIGVDAAIKDMGITSDGAMAVPGNNVDVGWFSYGTRPGETGSAVIGGHNLWNNKIGVFDHLDRLEKGDVVSVVDTNGVSTSFVVRDMRTYDATDTNSGIFESDSGTHLNLITCSGAWDPSTKSHMMRLVIFTDLVHSESEMKVATL